MCEAEEDRWFFMLRPSREWDLRSSMSYRMTLLLCTVRPACWVSGNGDVVTACSGGVHSWSGEAAHFGGESEKDE